MGVSAGDLKNFINGFDIGTWDYWSDTSRYNIKKVDHTNPDGLTVAFRDEPDDKAMKKLKKALEIHFPDFEVDWKADGRILYLNRVRGEA